jgi:hypothetical protein
MTQATQRLDHEFVYPKGSGIVDDDVIRRDALAQAKEFGGTLVSIERVPGKSNGGFYCWRATYDAPLKQSSHDDADLIATGPKGRVYAFAGDIPDGLTTGHVLPDQVYYPEGGEEPQGQPSDFPTTVVTEGGKTDKVKVRRDSSPAPEQPANVVTPGEPESELGHSEEQVRQIREGGPVPEPENPQQAPNTRVEQTTEESREREAQARDAVTGATPATENAPDPDDDLALPSATGLEDPAALGAPDPITTSPVTVATEPTTTTTTTAAPKKKAAKKE